MQQAHVVGSFSASGGSNNDIEVLLFTEDQFNRKEKRAHALYNSGKVSEGQMNPAIFQSGTYYLVFSNIFSVVSPKQVIAKIELRYRTAR